jgi:PAS domain S-box-containing protein
MTDQNKSREELLNEVAALHRQNAELEAKGQLFRRFVEGANDLLTQVDGQGNFTYVNYTAQKIFGLSPEECLGRSAFDFIHPDDQQKTQTAFMGWLSSRASTVTFENRQVNLTTGAVYHMLWEISLNYDQEGALISINSIARDITERKQAEATTAMLYEISRRLNEAKDEKELVEAIAHPAIAAGAHAVDLYYVDCDEAGQPQWLEKAAGWQLHPETPAYEVGSRVYVPDLPFGQLYFADIAQPLFIADVTTDERLDEKSRELIIVDGTHTLIIIPLSQAGHWLGLVGVGWDHPQQFGEAEQAIYNALPALASPAVGNHRLVNNLEKMVAERATEVKRILDAIQDSVISTDLEGTIISWNPASERMFGWRAEEVIGQKVTILYKEEDIPILVEKIVKPTLEHGAQEGEYRAVHKDGTEIIDRLHTSLVRDSYGQPVGMVGVASDIGERKQALEERERLQQELIEAQQRAIQELSTPIIPIMTGVIILPLMGAIDSSRARNITRSLLAGVSQHRAKVVILDITGVSVIDSGIAAHLDKTIQAARLKGAQTIISGVSDAVAETIVDLGIDWSGIETVSDLQTGLAVAVAKIKRL